MRRKESQKFVSLKKVVSFIVTLDNSTKTFSRLIFFLVFFSNHTLHQYFVTVKIKALKYFLVKKKHSLTTVKDLYGLFKFKIYYGNCI